MKPDPWPFGRRLLSASALALALSTSPSLAVGYQVYGGEIHLGMPKALDIYNLNWEFANDPNWGYEIFDCNLFPIIWADYIAWSNPPPPPYIPPPTIDPPPCLDCGPPITPPVVSVPETSTWLMMLLGFASLCVPAGRRAVRAIP